MSDMVQQPVIQLVQELTMTAVVERHDCTDTKKEEKSRSPRPRLNTNDAFCHSSKTSHIWHNLDKEECETPGEPSRHLSGGYSKTSLKWRQGTEDLSLLKRCWWAPSHFFFCCFVFLLSLFFLKRRRLTITALEEGRREGMLVMYSNGANSAGHLAIYKVVLRYQWDMLALEGHHLHIQGTWSITNRYMLE